MNIAVYRSRSDGDYDFVAAFDAEQLPQAPSNWPEEIAEWIKSEGDDALLIHAPDCNWPDVWSPQMQTEARTPNGPNQMNSLEQSEIANRRSPASGGSARRPKVKGWWEEYRCGCVSETAVRKKDLVGYCGKHGENRRQVFPELEKVKAPNGLHERPGANA